MRSEVRDPRRNRIAPLPNYKAEAGISNGAGRGPLETPALLGETSLKKGMIDVHGLSCHSHHEPLRFRLDELPKQDAIEKPGGIVPGSM